MQGPPTKVTILQGLIAVIIKCKCHLENACSNKFNNGNSEQFEKLPGKQTIPCKKYKLTTKQQNQNNSLKKKKVKWL